MNFPFVLLCLCAIVYETKCYSELIALQTKDMFYNMFPIKLNKFQLSVMTDEIASIILSPSVQPFEDAFYTINLRSKGRSWIQKGSSEQDNGKNSRDYNGNLLSYEQYRTFTIELDDSEGTISVKRGLNETIMFYKDSDFTKVKFFGVATEEVGAWGLHTYDFDCECCKH